MSAAPKTIMLVVHGGYVARYLLRTDILRTLRQADVRIVILTPNADEDYFRREFSGPNVFVEPYRLEACRAYRDRSRLQRTLAVIRHATLNGSGDVTTLDYNFSVIKEQGRTSGRFRRAYVAGVAAIVGAARRSALIRRMLVAFESTVFAPRIHGDVFDKHRPDLIVTTSLGYFDFDQFVMREARRAGASVLSIILSWDNPTSWGLGGARADAAIAWTPTMKQEIATYHDFPADRISVCGVAHFDTYFRPLKISREQVLAAFGLDPARRTILLGSRSPTRYPWNETVIEMIAKAIEESRFASDCQLLVRLHPIHFRQRDGRPMYEDVLKNYERLAARYAHLYFDAPVILSRKLPLDMPADDMDKLAALLHESAVLVTMLSTLNLEAAVFDLPMVNVCLGPGESFTHIKRLVTYGASVQVYNEAQLVDAINRYLISPHLEREMRARLAEAECGPNCGVAGEAIGREVLRVAGVPAPKVETVLPARGHALAVERRT